MVAMRFLALWAVAIAALALPSTAQAEVKALLIGSSYESAENEALRLANPLADLRIVSSALRGTSVDELTVLEEPSAEEWQVGLDAWLDTLTGDDIGLFLGLCNSEQSMLVPANSAATRWRTNA